MRAPITRPSTSVGPPAANGITLVTGRVGQSCAPAVAVSATSPAPAAARTLFSMAFSSLFFGTLYLRVPFTIDRASTTQSRHRHNGQCLGSLLSAFDSPLRRPEGD